MFPGRGKNISTGIIQKANSPVVDLSNIFAMELPPPYISSLVER